MRRMLIVMMMAAMVMGFMGCRLNSDDRLDLTGTITVTPNTGVVVGMELTASYAGPEDVTFQWRRGNTNVGTGETFTPTEAGNFTVTVSADGFNSLTSAVVNVSANGAGSGDNGNKEPSTDIPEQFRGLFRLNEAFSGMGHPEYFKAGINYFIINGETHPVSFAIDTVGGSYRVSLIPDEGGSALWVGSFGLTEEGEIEFGAFNISLFNLPSHHPIIYTKTNSH